MSSRKRNTMSRKRCAESAPRVVGAGLSLNPATPFEPVEPHLAQHRSLTGDDSASRFWRSVVSTGDDGKSETRAQRMEHCTNAKSLRYRGGWRNQCRYRQDHRLRMARTFSSPAHRFSARKIIAHAIKELRGESFAGRRHPCLSSRAAARDLAYHRRTSSAQIFVSDSAFTLNHFLSRRHP